MNDPGENGGDGLINPTLARDPVHLQNRPDRMLSTNEVGEIQNTNATELACQTRREENHGISRYGVGLLINTPYKHRIVLDGSVYHALIELSRVAACNTFPAASVCIGFLTGSRLSTREDEGEGDDNWEGRRPRHELRITGLVPTRRRVGGLLRGRTEIEDAEGTVPDNAIGLFSTYTPALLIF